MFNFTRKPIVSSDAYRTFVSFMFSAAITSWGATLLGLNPIMEKDLSHSWYFWHEPMYIWVTGFLYGAVLICIFWIYIEKLSTKLLPGTLGILGLDLVALSLMAGGAVTWHLPFPFIPLVACTIVLLGCRFWIAYRLETKAFNTRDPFFRDATLVYGLLLFALVCVGFGAEVLGQGLRSQMAESFIYEFVMLAMVAGIVITFRSSLKHIGPGITPPIPPVPPNDKLCPSLCPAYGVVPEERLIDVSSRVFRGEQLFRELLSDSLSRDSASLRFHLSRVHTYRDVETQAFIMAHHALNNREIEIRALWVYLAHWFDDMIDHYYAEAIAQSRFITDPHFDISTALRELDVRLESLWQNAIKYTTYNVAYCNESLLHIGMRRLILGGPMFSDSCAGRRADFFRTHRMIVVNHLDKNLSYGSFSLVNKMSDDYLACTAKVVVELWDSFDRNADFDLSMVMNLFYAPGLYYHDSTAEREFDEISEQSEFKDNVVAQQLDEVMEFIIGLPNKALTQSLRPVLLFVKSFEPVLKKEDLWGRYRNFLAHESIRSALPDQRRAS